MRSPFRTLSVVIIALVCLTACGQETFENVRKEPPTSVTPPTTTTSYSVVSPPETTTTEAPPETIETPKSTVTVTPTQTTRTVPPQSPLIYPNGQLTDCTGTVLPRGVWTSDSMYGHALMVGDSSGSSVTFTQVPEADSFTDICLQISDGQPPRGFMTNVSARWMNENGLTQIRISAPPDASDAIGVVLIQ